MADKLKSADMMPGNRGLPIIGELIGVITKQELYHWQQHQKYGNVFKVSLPLLFGDIACLIGPEANRLVLKDGADKLSSRLGNKSLESILTNDTVLLKDGEEHRTSRKMILPVFHRQAIASYFDTIQSVVTDTSADWGKRGTFNLSNELSKITLTVVVKIFLASEKTEEIDRVSQLFNTLVDSLRGAIVKWDTPLTNYGKGQAASRKIAEYVRQIIKERVARGDLEQSTDVLSLLINAVDEDRFAPPREEDKKQPYSLIGFGGGVHSCIGVELAQMEMKIILSTLLQKYDWTVTPTTAEISPVRRQFMMEEKLKATFVPLNPLLGGYGVYTSLDKAKTLEIPLNPPWKGGL